MIEYSQNLTKQESYSQDNFLVSNNVNDIFHTLLLFLFQLNNLIVNVRLRHLNTRNKIRFICLSLVKIHDKFHF